MREIIYTYTVIESDTIEKTFTVLYESEGRESITVKIKYPFVGDNSDLNLLIQQFSPVVQWINAERTTVPVEIGMTGIITAQFPDFA